jgi:DNA invertase Pin-like site-specific DNA recombinase
MIIGYARVSTDQQELDGQQTALKAAGAERIFSEKVSGAVTDRKALAKALSALAHGDVLLVTQSRVTYVLRTDYVEPLDPRVRSRGS